MLLLIPGPVTTRPEVRQALCQDLAPWDNDFRGFLRRLRDRVLHLAGGAEATHAALPLQGCGHFVTEAAIRTFLPPGGRILIPATGAYADRMVRLAREAGRVPVTAAGGPRTTPWTRRRCGRALDADPTLTHVGMVYCETGSGMIHDVRPGRRGGARGRPPDDRRRRLRLRRAAARPVGAAGGRCRRVHLQQMPGGAARPGLRRRPDRPAAGLRAATRGSWSFDLADIYEHALRVGLGQLPLHAAGAGAGRLRRRRSTCSTPRAAAGAAGPLHRQHARAVRRRPQHRACSPCLPEALQGPIVVNVHAPERPGLEPAGASSTR